MRPQSKAVVTWLTCLCTLIVLMVWVGGVTRLTGSGLSIVDWNPIMGAIPPLNDRSWNEAFSKYQASPQYRLINAGMSLAEFKRIFFWEYIHRLLGRLMGIALFLPAVVLLVRRKLDLPLARRLAIVFVLGGLQGALGWYMVKSGLVDKPYVSHYRLAAHLLFALSLLGYMEWVVLDSIYGVNPTKGARKTPQLLHAILLLTIVQIFYGALTAGLKAGFAFNTFPTMAGAWLPPGGMDLEPFWSNFLDNPATVQFTHRLLGTALAIAIACFFWRNRTNRCAKALLIAVAVQYCLGVATLVFVVPLGLASAHQLGATVLFLVALWSKYEYGADLKAAARRDL